MEHPVALYEVLLHRESRLTKIVGRDSFFESHVPCPGPARTHPAIAIPHRSFRFSIYKARPL
jgi:hypothetical protein